MIPPLVTIGITAWNSAGTIETAIHSALAQDWRPIEILVVDDASTDETAIILARIAAKHIEIRVSPSRQWRRCCGPQPYYLRGARRFHRFL